MTMFFLYRIGQSIALALPVKLAYRMAEFLSGIKFFFCRQERDFMRNNMRVILGENNPNVEKYPRQIYANFAKYLVDFFRTEKIDKAFIDKFVKIEKIHYMDEALKKGKGAIGLTAHIGNWELCAQVMGIMGYKMNAIALVHTDKRVNEFFTNQRKKKGVTVIPVGVAVRKCFAALKRNEIVGILGDRDFSGENGIVIDFLGKFMLIPRGPAILSLRTGAAIVPAFVIRDEKDDRYLKYIFEKPIYPKTSGNEEQDIKDITLGYSRVIEEYIRKYPQQWFIFHEFWKAQKVEVV